MPTWIIEPRDPLIVRDGRPFGPTPGARAVSLAFPFPSTTTGGVRTRAGLDAQGQFDPAKIPTVQAMGVRGPLLVELADTGPPDTDGRIVRWLAPAPADALLLQPPEGAGQKDPVRKRLCPLGNDPPVQTAAPQRPAAAGTVGTALSLVGPQEYDPSKPLTDAPRYWYWAQLEAWLHDPPHAATVQLAELGHDGPQLEQRLHVGIQSDTGTALEGALFQTRGLEFTRDVRRPAASTEILELPKWDRHRLALAVASAGGFEHFAGGLAPLGGERRLMQWRTVPDGAPDPFAGTCPDAICNKIVAEHACRLVLLTPAYFEQGFCPTWLLQSPVVQALRAAAVGRPQVVSGWDFVANNGKGGAKPTRRLAPAGSVFFLKLGEDQDTIRAWIDTIWMHCVSDAAQDRLDGFGLAVLGSWSGKAEKMQVSRQMEGDNEPTYS
ncbi:MAG: type III-B CRISPR module-associated protein Cmr3 [Chloroflexota bacterium]|nr:type III-B CRISPR module-associated protein Cmr3 [Chloroflexota bacterium]